MSVIVRTPTGGIEIFCKGAETVILPRLQHHQAPRSGEESSVEGRDFVATTEQHINHYARQGMLTL